MNKNHHAKNGGTAGFVLYVALLTILTAGAVGGFFIYSAYNHSQGARRWHEADQCLLDAQSALEQVKYEMIQAYGSNSQSATTWFLNWSSNAIGAAPSYNIPSPLTVNGTPVFVTLSWVTVITNAGASLVTLTLVADARKGDNVPVRRKIQEQVQMSVGTGGVPVFANCAIGMYGTNDKVNVTGKLTIDGDNWNPPATFNQGNGTQNNPSPNDMPGVVYASAQVSTNVRISIDGNPPQTSVAGAYDAAYWQQFVDTIIPAATTYKGGSLGTRSKPVITILPSGTFTFSSAISGAGILIVPKDVNVSINDKFYYEGLIIQLSDNNKDRDLTVNNMTTLYGALVCVGNRCGIKVPGTLNVLYSKQALDNLSNIITNMQFASSSGSNGVPYTYNWREIN